MEDRPVLWVGAGASIAAGYPTRDQLAAAIREDADSELPAGLGLHALADAYIRADGPGPLNRLLFRMFQGQDHQPTAFHRAVARLARSAQVFSAIVTSNHDRLIERALEAEGVAHVVQRGQHNAELAPELLRVIKLHGATDDWWAHMLSGEAHEAFDDHYGLLAHQLELLLTRHPVLFVGCSMTHPRILQWLARRSREALDQLDRWRPMMTLGGWERACAGPWHDGTAGDVLARALVRPMIVHDHTSHLCQLWTEAADRKVPGALWRVPDLPPRFLARPDALAAVVNGLCATEGSVGRVLRHGIHGMGGLGKTALAIAVARDPRIRARFADGVFWLTVGRVDDATGVQAQLAHDLGLVQTAFDGEVDGQQRLARALADKRVLLVLDDVWEVARAEALDMVDECGRVLITTRNLDVLTYLEAWPYALEAMSSEQAHALLADWSGLAVAALPPEASELVETCGRLPLALAIAGAMVRRQGGFSRTLRWLQTDRLDKLRGRLPTYGYRTVHQAIAASVHQLTEANADLEHLEARYAELAVFAEDLEIPAVALSVLWSRHGLDSEDVYELASMLATHSLAHHGHDMREDSSSGEHDWHLRLHDIQRTYCRASTRDMMALHSGYVDAWAARCVAGQLARGPMDAHGWDYFHAQMPYHLIEAGRVDELRRLLGCYRWLQHKLQTCGLVALLADFRRLGELGSEERELMLIRDALRLSSHVLARATDELPGQLIGRLGAYRDVDELATVQQLLRDARSTSGAWLCPMSASLMAPGGPLSSTLAGHARSVVGVALSADGMRAVTASSDGTARVWNPRSGELLGVLAGHGQEVTCAAMSADGRCVLTGADDGLVGVWDAERAVLLHRLTGHTERIGAVAWSADGRRALIGSDDGSARLWDTASGQLLHRFADHDDAVTAVALSSDGIRALTGGRDGSVRAWATGDGRLLAEYDGHEQPIVGLWLDASSARFASACAFGQLVLRDAESGDELRDLQLPVYQLSSVAISADGRRALCGDTDGALLVLDLESEQTLATLRGHDSWVEAVALSADGRWGLSCGLESTARSWDLDAVAPGIEVAGPLGSLTAATLSQDGRHLLWRDSSPGVTMRDIHTGAQEGPMAEELLGISALASSADGTRALIGGFDGVLALWDAASGRRCQSLAGHVAAVSAVALNRACTLAISGDQAAELCVWNLASGELVSALAGQSPAAVNALAISDDGAVAVAGGSDGRVRVWQIPSQRPVATFEGHRAPVLALALAGGGRWAVTGAADGTAMLWDLERNVLQHDLTGHRVAVTSVVVHEDELKVVTGAADGSLVLWDVATGEAIAGFAAEGPVLTSGFSAGEADGPVIVACDETGRIHRLRLLQPGGDPGAHGLGG